MTLGTMLALASLFAASAGLNLTAIEAELERSVDRFRARTLANNTEKLVALLLGADGASFKDRAANPTFKTHLRAKHPTIRQEGDIVIFFLFGRVFTRKEHLAEEHKLRYFAAMLSSAALQGVALPNCAFLFATGAAGNPKNKGVDKGKCFRKDVVPQLVIAKREGYGPQCGILVPNPYWGDGMQGGGGNLAAWAAEAAGLRKAAAARPLAGRAPRVLWRGEIKRNAAMESARLTHDQCRKEHGNHVRLEAVALTAKKPSLFDVKCTKLDPPGDFSCLADPEEAAALADARDAVLRSPAAVLADEWLTHEDYTRYRYVLNLPGQSSGSYSRNLNHLWATGAVVLLWEATHVEWYYPALVPGTTHLEVNQSSAVRVVERLQNDPAAVAALVEGAARVQDELVSAPRIADYLRRVFEAVRRRVGYSLVLDDPAAVLAIASRTPGACDGSLVEVEVDLSFGSAGKGLGNRTAGPHAHAGRGICDVLRAIISAGNNDN